MLKKSDDVASMPDGDVIKTTKWGCGPVPECSGCPCLLVIRSDEKKDGYCAYYMAHLNDGEYPKNCKIVRMTFEELL